MRRVPFLPASQHSVVELSGLCEGRWEKKHNKKKKESQKESSSIKD